MGRRQLGHEPLNTRHRQPVDLRSATFDYWRLEPDGPSQTYRQRQIDYSVLNQLVLPLLGHVDTYEFDDTCYAALEWLLRLQGINDFTIRRTMTALIAVIQHAEGDLVA